MSLLERYLAGERAEVWNELIARGPAFGPDAQSVIDEIVRRVRENVFKIAESLAKLGYQFRRSEGPFVLRSKEGMGRLDRAEQAWGRFPRLVRRLYEVFEFVDFSQHDNQIGEGPLRGLGFYPQLFFLNLTELAELRQEMEAAAGRTHEFMSKMMKDRGEKYPPLESRSGLYLGPCASNNDMKGFLLPCDAVDAVYFDDGGGPVCFYEDLSNTFRCGGFPQLMKYIRHESLRSALGMKEPQRILDCLTRNLEMV
jgi:hypothetical protein